MGFLYHSTVGIMQITKHYLPTPIFPIVYSVALDMHILFLFYSHRLTF